MLFESFWSSFGQDWRAPFLSFFNMSRGRAFLKRHLALASSVDVKTLPYNSKVINYIEEWRRSGGRTALVTASDQILAEKIAREIGLFDEVYGSDGTLNLKGECKAQFLEERFGRKGFHYMGDHAADIPIWRRAAKAITVGASHSLRCEAERACDSIEHIVSERSSTKTYIKALRMHQWLKNVLVLLPMLAAHQFDGPTFFLSLIAFLSFSLMASGIYVVNDLIDLTADRSHPRKQNRPFASGDIPIYQGMWMAAGLFLIGVVLAISVNAAFVLAILGYCLLTTAYSLILKRRIILDIFALTALYSMRIVAGSLAAGITLSVWLLAFSAFFFLALAAVKRQAELADIAMRGELEVNGRGYHVNDLPIVSMIAIAAGYVSVLVMMLYVNSPQVMNLYGLPEALWGVSAVLLFWITQTVMLAHRGEMHDDPVVYAATDRTSLMCLLAIVVFLFWGGLS
ncbi:UbiA family prenyltransferase [Roseovarius faecimaris]|nr:UbiA family prenyltransferase [Roseovarius faecimaris]